MRLIIEKLFERASINDAEHFELVHTVFLTLLIITVACLVCACLTTCCFSWCTPLSVRRFICGITCIMLVLLLIAAIITTDSIETSVARAAKIERKGEKLYMLLEDD
jgi:hypothetical protein